MHAKDEPAGQESDELRNDDHADPGYQKPETRSPQARDEVRTGIERGHGQKHGQAE